jgi:hypothetical protein
VSDLVKVSAQQGTKGRLGMLRQEQIEPTNKTELLHEEVKQMDTKEITTHFLKELHAEDSDDFYVLDMRISALVEELGVKKAATISLDDLDQILKEVRQK